MDNTKGQVCTLFSVTTKSDKHKHLFGALTYNYRVVSSKLVETEYWGPIYSKKFANGDICPSFG